MSNQMEKISHARETELVFIVHGIRTSERAVLYGSKRTSFSIKHTSVGKAAATNSTLRRRRARIPISTNFRGEREVSRSEE